MNNLEKRLYGLENANRQRKTTYPVAGSLIGFVVQESQVFSETKVVGEATSFRIKFTPKDAATFSLCSLTMTGITRLNSSGDSFDVFKQDNTIQAGDGSVIIEYERTVSSSTVQTYTTEVRVIAAGMSEGTFTRL